MRKLAYAAFSFSAAVFFVILIPGLEKLPLWVAITPVVLGFLIRKTVNLRITISILAFSAGLLWVLVFNSLFFDPALKLTGTTNTVTATVLDYPIKTDYGYRSDVKIVLTKSPDVKARLYYSKDFNLTPGDKIKVTADFSLSQDSSAGKTHRLNSSAIFLTGNVSGTPEQLHRSSSLHFWPARTANSVLKMIDNLFEHENSAFMRALLIGDRDELNKLGTINSPLAVTGASHIVAVSGMHLSFLVGFIGLLIKRKRIFCAIAIPVMFFFMAMVGFTPSVTRAGIMQIFIMTAPLLNRESDGITTISAALFILLLINPYACASVGLQLSFASVLGIVLFTDKISTALEEPLINTKAYSLKSVQVSLHFIISGLSATAGVTILTVPLTALHFGYVSLISVFTNLLVLWTVSITFIGGFISVIIGFALYPAGAFFAGIVSVFIRYILLAVRLLARVPFAVVYVQNRLIIVWLVYVYSLGILFAVFRTGLRKSIYPICFAVNFLCIILLATSLAANSEKLTVTVLDVGQGQAVALSHGSFNALVDCGGTKNSGQAAHEYFLSRAVTTIDLLILTHFHEDHVNGVPDLLSRMTVSKLAIPDPDIGGSDRADDIIELARRYGTEIIYITQSLNLIAEGMELTLHPPLGDETENELGLTVVCSAGDFDVLITGDMDSKNERRLLRYTTLPDIELLVAGHHGSSYSTSNELLDSAKPEYAVISLGLNNYGHPAPDTLERLALRGITVFRTDLSGNITFTSP